MNMRSRVLRAIASVMWRGLAGVVALGAATAALAQADKPLTIGVIELFPNPHFAHARKGIEEFAKKNNTNVIIQNANLDATKEAQFIQTFITRKVDAILVSAVSPTGSLAALRFARSAGIPVVCYTTCVNAPEDQGTGASLRQERQLDPRRHDGQASRGLHQGRTGRQGEDPDADLRVL